MKSKKLYLIKITNLKSFEFKRAYAESETFVCIRVK